MFVSQDWDSERNMWLGPVSSLPAHMKLLMWGYYAGALVTLLLWGRVLRNRRSLHRVFTTVIVDFLLLCFLLRQGITVFPKLGPTHGLKWSFQLCLSTWDFRHAWQAFIYLSIHNLYLNMIMVHVCNSSTWKAHAGRLCSLGYFVRFCLRTNKNKAATTKNIPQQTRKCFRD